MTQAIFVEIAKSILSIILTLFAILGYTTKVREFIGRRYGRYFLGFTDGIILTLFLMMIAFYVSSWVTS